MVTYQITIPASGKVRITDTTAGFFVNVPANTMVQTLLIQNNAAHSIRVGDSTVTSTKGVQITASGSSNFGAFMNYNTMLSDWWIDGTAGDVIDILYIQ